MKRNLILLATALMVVIGATVAVMAQPPHGRGGRGGFGRMGVGPFPMLRALNLTDDQRQQIRTLAEARRTEGGTVWQKLGDLHKQLQLATFAETPDLQKIQELKAQLSAATAEQLDARIDLETRIAAILTPEQRAQARDRLQNRPARGQK
jgi:protein CpxP